MNFPGQQHHTYVAAFLLLEEVCSLVTPQGGGGTGERGRRERGRKKGREGIRKDARGFLQRLLVFSAPYDRIVHPE